MGTVQDFVQKAAAPVQKRSVGEYVALMTAASFNFVFYTDVLLHIRHLQLTLATTHENALTVSLDIILLHCLYGP